MLNDWAQRHNITPVAYRELLTLLSAGYVEPVPTSQGLSETATTQRTRLAASRKGARLFRNNRGMAYNDNGQPIRYGLANDSQVLGQKFRSSDLIGILPYRVRRCDVGRVLGIFLAVEMKRGGWKFKGDEHEQGQQNFLNLILSLGGFAQFAQGPEDLLI